jgi:hypothetical protein
MSEPKPFASLSSGLLARKGAAKPAMRPQGFGQLGSGIEDLGWNDMGHLPSVGFAGYEDDEPREHVPSSIAALTPAPKPQELQVEDNASPEPPVIEQQRTIAATFAAPEAESPKAAKQQAVTTAPVVVLPTRPRQAAGTKAKAAFTLRLDPDRHFKLRLACAVLHRSAQQIVSDALETYLNAVPELDALTQQLPAKAAKRN